MRAGKREFREFFPNESHYPARLKPRFMLPFLTITPTTSVAWQGQLALYRLYSKKQPMSLSAVVSRDLVGLKSIEGSAWNGECFLNGIQGGCWSSLIGDTSPYMVVILQAITTIAYRVKQRWRGCASKKAMLHGYWWIGWSSRKRNTFRVKRDVEGPTCLKIYLIRTARST